MGGNVVVGAAVVVGDAVVGTAVVVVGDAVVAAAVVVVGDVGVGGGVVGGADDAIPAEPTRTPAAHAAATINEWGALTGCEGIRTRR